MIRKQRKPKLRVWSYKPGSRSAKTLAVAAGGRVLKHQGSKYKPRPFDLVVNWGSSEVPDFNGAKVLNQDIGEVSCKLSSFQKMHEQNVQVPQFWTDKDEIPEDCYPVVCRTVLRGHSGKGIVIADTPEELVDAPLYTKYVKKKHEYRVHVFKGESFFVQRKAKKHAVEDPDWRVRNLEGGFVFAECDDTPQQVLDQAEAAAEALEVDFGGVDVIWNEHEGKAYVLEINTACGLEERTAEKYADKIRDYFEGER